MKRRVWVDEGEKISSSRIISFEDPEDLIEFFKYVADDVQWRVMGTHPLAGTYKSKQDFLEHTFHRLNKILKGSKTQLVGKNTI